MATSMRIDPSESSRLPAALGVPDGWEGLTQTLRRVIAQAEALGLAAEFQVEELRAEPSPEAALRRLVTGAGAPGDDGLLTMPLRGARLVAVSAPEFVAAERAFAALSRESGCLVLEFRPDLLLALVRHSPRRSDDDRALNLARRVGASVVQIGSRVTAAISAAVSLADDLPAAFTDTVDALTIAEASPGRIVEVGHVWASLSLYRLRRYLPQCVSAAAPTRRLLEHDARRGTEFGKTLSVWLRNNQDTRATAAELCIHSNTLRYRIRRAAELVDLDLADPEQRLVTQLLLS
jgi:PucR C-terminal helix-turn-helix domain